MRWRTGRLARVPTSLSAAMHYDRPVLPTSQRAMSITRHRSAVLSLLRIAPLVLSTNTAEASTCSPRLSNVLRVPTHHAHHTRPAPSPLRPRPSASTEGICVLRGREGDRRLGGGRLGV